MTSDTDVRQDGSEHSGTNLVIHHDTTDIFCEDTKPIHILSVQKPRDPASLFQREEAIENIV